MCCSGRTWLTFLTAWAVVVAALFQLYGRPLLQLGGRSREITALGNAKCRRDKSLQACEKIVLHEPTGLIYLACSTPHRRTLWLPTAGNLNKTGARHDYIAVYNPATESATRLPLVRFNPSDDLKDGTGLSVLGLDVVTSAANEHEILVYVVNHRPPLGDAWVWGPDTAVEIFKGEAGGKKLEHVATVRDPLIGLANDVLGSPDGKSFYITNQPRTMGSFKRAWHIITGLARTTVTHCRVDEGCKTAARNVAFSNGIARGTQGEIYVSSTYTSQIYVFEAQADDTLILNDMIPIGGGGLDNLSVDKDGAVYVAEYPKVFSTNLQYLADPFHKKAPSAVLRISLNEDESSYFGQKYNVEKIFEDDGKLASGITTAVFDKERNRLFMHGVASTAFVHCDL
ncbi:calcium-dependent phosphotriesterase [Auricularia subglabra TFB-10046 SS5]|nr:calcium-dependent phosphotriesterase [Auricularia subglabra TFB-10046 SS5]